MNRRTFLYRASLATAAVCTPAGGRLGGRSVSGAEPRGAFRPLFDGESLDGWHHRFAPRDHPGPGNFLVRDGAIWATQLPDRMGALLLSDETFRDFELALEIHSDWGCDSGVFLRSDEQGRCIQILNDYLENGCVGFVFGQGTGGYISRPIRLFGEPPGGAPRRVVARDKYDGVAVDKLTHAIDAAQWNAIWRHGEYNDLRIRIQGDAPIIETYVNGAMVMGFDGRSYHGRFLKDEGRGDLAAPSAWDRAKVNSLTGDGGHIGLQVHPGPRWGANAYARYRNLRIRELA